MRDIPGISPKMLTARLRDLEEKGVVVRAVMPTSPPSVEYSLSELGRELIPVINTIVRVGTRIREGAMRRAGCSLTLTLPAPLSIIRRIPFSGECHEPRSRLRPFAVPGLQRTLAAGLRALRECRRLLRRRPDDRLARPLLPADQGPAVLRLRRRRRAPASRWTPRGRAWRPGSTSARTKSIRAFDLAEHLRAGAGAAPAPRSPATRSSSPTRTTRRTSAPTRRLAEDGFVVREWKVNPATAELERRTSRRCSARARSSSRSRIARTSSAASTRCANSPTSRTRPAPGRSWTASPFRRTACRTSRSSASTPTISRSTRCTARTWARCSCGARSMPRCRTRDTSSTTAKPGARFTPAGPDHAQIAAVNGVARLPGRGRGPSRPGRQARAGTRGRRCASLFRDARDRAAPAAARFPRRPPEGAAHRPHARSRSRADGLLHGEGQAFGRHRERTRGGEDSASASAISTPIAWSRRSASTRRRRRARVVRALHVEGRSGPPDRGSWTGA